MEELQFTFIYLHLLHLHLGSGACVARLLTVADSFLVT